MEQLELFEPSTGIFLAWCEEMSAHVYFDRADPAWRGMSTCLFNQVRGYEQTCKLCHPRA